MQKKVKSNLACLLALVVFALLTVFEFIGDTLLQTSQENKYYILFVVQVVLFLAPAFVLMHVQKAKPREFLRLRTYRMRWLPATIFGAMTATFGSVLLNLLLINLPLPAAMQPAVTDVFSQVTSDPFAPFLAVVVAPAILEELFVHGALLSTLQHRSMFRGLLLTSPPFAMLHSSLTNFLGPLFAAFVYGLLTVTFQSVYPAMIAHFLNNMLAGSILLFGQNIRRNRAGQVFRHRWRRSFPAQRVPVPAVHRTLLQKAAAHGAHTGYRPAVLPRQEWLSLLLYGLQKTFSSSIMYYRQKVSRTGWYGTGGSSLFDMDYMYCRVKALSVICSQAVCCIRSRSHCPPNRSL